jgi:hypothetical protein
LRIELGSRYELIAAERRSAYTTATVREKVRSMPSSEDLPRTLRVVVMVTVAALPPACAVPAPDQVENRFVGTWTTTENTGITIRPDTIVQHQPGGESTALDKDTCRGVFRFTHGTKTRQDLTGLVPRQPDLQRRLSDLLVDPSYPVVQLDCDRGDQTYVMLNDRQLVAIYRDGDIGAIDRLARQ